MKHCLSFLLFVAVCVHAQDAAKPADQQPEPGVADYYGAYAPVRSRRSTTTPTHFSLNVFAIENLVKHWMWAWVQAEILSTWLLTVGMSLGSI